MIIIVYCYFYLVIVVRGFIVVHGFIVVQSTWYQCRCVRDCCMMLELSPCSLNPKCNIECLKFLSAIYHHTGIPMFDP